ncbi:MAG TPA: DNA polymerase/3'-5' exonuclease PolX [Candidatus Acidoferrales bacterium]|nr:DNA polymerase/3'-5' exonuclease PolX [Candidatus Acidoferrales bacterium]
MDNKIIADMFDEIASMLSLDERPTARFEVRAYQKAALTISGLQEAIEDIYKKGGKEALMALPGIGKGIAGSIAEYIDTGHMEKYEYLKKEYPIDMKGLTSIQGLGPRKAVALYKELGVKDIKTLKKAIASHKIAKLEGFGEKSEGLMLKGIALLERSSGRMLLGDALPVAEAIVDKLNKSGLVEEALVAGSARRMRETVGDLDILAISEKSAQVMKFFAALSEVEELIAEGPTRTSVRLKIGLNCDLRVIPKESFGAALQYFTGSKDHNVQVRTISVKKGYRLNEYGLFDKKGKIMPTKSEKEIYAKLGMQWMPPEMRESRGEVKLAQEGALKMPIELSDIKGDMHTHGMDGVENVDTLEVMVDAAMKLGLKYLASTNHTKVLRIERGMDEKQFEIFFKKVDALNKKLDGKIKILKGAEVDILKDGSLDLNAKCLGTMEWVVGSVHSDFGMSEEDMTKRIVKAIDSGLIDVVGHPTGRQMPSRDAYKVDLDRVYESAERNRVALEIDASPKRLDLNDTNIMNASKYKVKFSIDSDAHRTPQFAYMRYGVGTARRGWLTKDRIINTMTLKELSKYLDLK